jgi:hypothetical protein
MKHTHAAALALVGWYLIAPPLINNDPARLVSDAPISSWEIISAFDTAAECEQERTSLYDSYPRYHDATLRKAAETRDHMLACIATDDPRLKEK